MIRNKPLFHIITASLALLVLTACGGAEPAPADIADAVEEPADQPEPTSEPEPTEIPVFAPLGGGGRVVYLIRNEEGGISQGTALQDGTEAKIFSNEDYKWWFMGGYSTDGAMFCGPVTDELNQTDLYVINADGTDLQIVREHTEDWDYGFISFAGDNDHIVYSAGDPDDGPYQFYYGTLDGSEEFEITVDMERRTRPAWGSGVLYFAGTYDDDTDIYMVEIETGEVTKVFETPEFDYFPLLSPDGTKLLWFIATEPYEILVGDLETGTFESIAVGSSPIWAPDGGIVFLDRTTSIYSYMNVDGSGITPLTEIFPELMAFAEESIFLQP